MNIDMSEIYSRVEIKRIDKKKFAYLNEPGKYTKFFFSIILLLIVLLSNSDVKAQTQTWYIQNANDWQNLQSYLPKAKITGTNINIALLPPSQCPPINPSGNYSEPYKLDFVTWASEIAKLSLRYSNIKGYFIQDVNENISSWISYSILCK